MLAWRRPRQTVLTGITRSLAAGERVGLCGPNGSGKSTLMRVAAGIERPSEGQVRLFGEDPEATRARKRIGFLPEGAALPGELSARTALELFASLHGFERATRKRRVLAMLERVGLSEARDKELRLFSKGMLRRFGLAHAFLADPDLVFLDEPTAGLDAEGHVVLAELLADARERGAALLLASHHLEDVERHAERLWVLLHGEIVADGPPRDVLALAPDALDEAESEWSVTGLSASDRAAVEAEVTNRDGAMRRRGRADLGELYRRHERAREAGR